ncbi:hypothetical protein HW532_02630 [Kaustia mangrovi]|uniref:Nickel/cobalt transporter regulator n=1 Tax=Kaustia mangrovi TaxID=2593653 RepID=A0A7S8HE48_9HYPH|nr:hypothetical protein HW532_02630 [Kaustia mangrovi]
MPAAALAVALAVAIPVAASVPALGAPPGGFKIAQGQGQGHGKGNSQKRGRKKPQGHKQGQGQGKGQSQSQSQSRGHGAKQGGQPSAKPGFGNNDRVAVRDYFAGLFEHGRCPPGLAKKHNGCMPPGQVRRWTIGQPLPRDVTFYDLEPALLRQLAPLAPGYRYVRVASDILMIAVGTGMVVSAIENLGR